MLNSTKIDIEMATELMRKWYGLQGFKPDDLVFSKMHSNEAPMVFGFTDPNTGRDYFMIFLDEYTCLINELQQALETTVYQCCACRRREVTDEEMTDDRNWMVGITYKDEDFGTMCMDCASIWLDGDMNIIVHKVFKTLSEITSSTGQVATTHNINVAFLKKVAFLTLRQF